ncbi:putative disease resistance protein rga4 [Quercus suber]|uniref:Disease resistance protein rga4 n=1 Tax=Quercus suber TaxID=58331 RepID=A0AAW0LJ36_QUESU
MGRQRDQFWDYAENLNARFKCNYCGRNFPGGASRIKAHLAGVRGHDIVACNAVPQDVQEKAQATQKKREAQVTQGTNKKLKSVSTSASKSKTKTIKIVSQGKEEYRAEIFLNDVVDRLIALATEHINFELSFKVDLLETLFKMKFMLGDAQKRQSSDESMGIWLKHIRDVAYDADNVLDKFSYESYWQKAQIQNEMMDQVCNFSLCNLDKVRSIKQFLDRYLNDVADSGLRMESIPSISLNMNIDSFNDSEVVGRKQDIKKIVNLLISLNMNTDSLNDLEVVGRKQDIKKIVNLLTGSSNQHVISVLPMVGMAGIGKTTLAKFVYNNEQIKKHFDVLAWVNVSKNFDVEGILREILKSLGFKSLEGEDLSNLNSDEVREICAEILWAKKYLLILDDVQNEDFKKWDTLKGYLLEFNSNIGNNIVITTRSDNVGQIMKIHPPHHLENGVDFTKLRTLISQSINFDIMLSNFKCLRVLKLSGDSIKELPDSIEQLIHLRLLHISDSLIEELPKSITKLYNLQTLRIEGRLEELPEDLSHLFNLRHIHINHIRDYGYIMQTPKNMRRLTCLQTLPFFVVDPEEGYRITELRPLRNLRGEINIYNLENVEEEEEAKSAKLKEKEIFKLGLYWDKGSDKDEKVLEGLQPHPNLKSLTIERYFGKKFPSWVGLSSLYHNLVEINLRDCNECEEVPTLGQLPCLRVLEIYGMKKVRCIGSEFYFYSDGSYRNTTTTLFPALRILKLKRMETLEEWKEADEVLSVFPCLEELIIRFCNKLRYLPDSLRTCVSLQKLEVYYCYDLSSWPGVRSLQKLVVWNCPKLRSLPGVRWSIIRCGIEDPPSGLQCIEYLENEDCRLPSSSTSSIHPSLQKLKLIRCGSLLLDQIQYFIALKILWIEESYEMVALPEGLGNLSSLQQLYIVDCLNLVHLPTEEAMRRLTQLKTLIIYDCHKFEDNERIKISHVPWVKINDDDE